MTYSRKPGDRDRVVALGHGVLDVREDALACRRQRGLVDVRRAGQDHVLEGPGVVRVVVALAPRLGVGRDAGRAQVDHPERQPGGHRVAETRGQRPTLAGGQGEVVDTADGAGLARRVDPEPGRGSRSDGRSRRPGRRRRGGRRAWPDPACRRRRRRRRAARRPRSRCAGRRLRRSGRSWAGGRPRGPARRPAARPARPCPRSRCRAAPRSPTKRLRRAVRAGRRPGRPGQTDVRARTGTLE